MSRAYISGSKKEGESEATVPRHDALVKLEY